MNYAVNWSENAFDAMLRYLVSLNKSAASVTAIDQINKRLAANPHDSTADVHEGLWRITIGPLRVYYEISEAEHQVEVVAFRAIE